MSDLIRTPHYIERRSFEIIEEELGNRKLDPLQAPLIKRVIHTTADFEMLNLISFNHRAIESALEALKGGGVTIYTDTNMALSGISKPALKELGARAVCYVSDADVIEGAKARGTTRAVAGINKSLNLEGPVIYAIGNAPTALLHLCECVKQGKVKPALVIGAPVGFVNVVESKEALAQLEIPSIIIEGRKGGSTISAALCNALLYGITRGEFGDS